MVHLASTLAVAALVFALLFRLPRGRPPGLARRRDRRLAVLVVILWVYYSGLILFVGAEMSQVYANRFGRGIQVTERAEHLPDHPGGAGIER